MPGLFALDESSTAPAATDEIIRKRQLPLLLSVARILRRGSSGSGVRGVSSRLRGHRHVSSLFASVIPSCTTPAAATPLIGFALGSSSLFSSLMREGTICDTAHTTVIQYDMTEYFRRGTADGKWASHLRGSIPLLYSRLGPPSLHCTGWTRFDEYPTELYRPRPLFVGQSVDPLGKANISGCTKY